RAVELPGGRVHLAAWHDLSEQKEAQRRHSDILSLLGHELRNPLGPIRHSVEILRLLSPADPELQTSLAVIDRQAAFMGRLMDDLLDLSRISRGKILLRKEPCDLSRLVREAAEDYRGTLEGHGLELALQVSDEPLWVFGDRLRLLQV